ncbi:glycosyltransferase family 2 protein [Kaistella sp.]|uniref:glycosyltransferase family 2 protein n=1 Tax=Kaistella sp. TaxID=2782235 RepID=UPI0035A0A057
MKTSVALCTFNGEKYLRKQLDSILEQTVAVDEIVICDDLSTDATLSILNQYKETFPNIFKIHANEKNLRSVKNFEKAISLCENEIVFLCDQDDMWIPEKVEVILNQFKISPELQVIATNAFIINDDEDMLNVSTIYDIPSKTTKEMKEILFFHQNFCTGATIAMRKEFADDLMPFPPENLFHHDEWIALKASLKNQLLFLNDRLIKYRIHQNQLVGGVIFSEQDLQKRIDKIELPAEEMNSKIIFSFLKKVKRKMLDIEKFRTIEHQQFFDLMLKELKAKKEEISLISDRKFKLLTFFYKLTGKI